MIYKDGDQVTFSEGRKGEPVDGEICGRVQAFPLVYIVKIPMDGEKFRYVIADEKELKIRRN